MKPERLPIEEILQKNAWLAKLSAFIVKANINTWAADATEVMPQRPGYKELSFSAGDFELRDSYTGYFRAPGMTTVYFKGMPVWCMQYGGHGQTEGYEDRAKQTYEFLKTALRQVTPHMPFRGPRQYSEGQKHYSFIIEGDITDGLWREEIIEDGILTFTQTGLVGIVINRDENKKPIYPWNL